jgi:hypothetical protein
MTEEQQQLIRIIANQLFGVKVDIEDVTDWYSIMKEAQQQAVFPLAFQALKSSIPAEQLKPYTKEYAANQASYVRNLHFHAELHKLLNGIPYVILKGQASAVYYPNPMLRSMGDVDFLVHKEDRGKVNQLLKAEGFTKRDGAEKHDYHWAYKKDRTSLELHWDVPGVPDSMKNRFSADAINAAEEKMVLTERMMLPSTFHHGLVLLLHTISHMTGGGIGLRHLCDWLIFENSVPEEEFLDIFEDQLKDIGLWTFAKVMTKIGVLYFGTKRKWCLEANDEVCRCLLEDILSGGNFGTKDNTRRSQAKLIQNRVTKSVHGNVLKNGLVSINEKAKRDYPYCRENLILRPVGWAAVVGQYMMRVISGKRNNVFEKKIMSNARNRQKLYAELRLFELNVEK